MAAKKVINTVTFGVGFSDLNDLVAGGADSFRPPAVDTMPQDYLDAGVNRAAWCLVSVTIPTDGSAGGVMLFELRPIA